MVIEYKDYIGVGKDNFDFTMSEERFFSDDMNQMLDVIFIIKNTDSEEVIFEDVWEYDWEEIDEEGR